MIDFDRLVLGPCVSAFGQAVTYQSGEGPTYIVRAIFEQALKEIRPDRDGTLIDSARPILGLRVSDLILAGVPADRLPCEGELIITAAPPLTWVISNAEPPDSEGHLKLSLKRTDV